jgi:asparagine synthase (glutamine-hydrolysing)
VKVLLSGEGADCLFCGYYGFNLIYWSYVKNPVSNINPLFSKFIQPFFFPQRYRNKLNKIKNALAYLPDKFILYHGDLNYNNKNSISQLLELEFPLDFGKNYTLKFSKYTKDNIMDIILDLYQTNFLIEELNAINKLGDAYNIEHRHPFIDLKLIQRFNKFPWEEKIKFFIRKHQVNLLARKYLPKDIWDRPKEGFGVPLDTWFYDEKGLGRFIGLLSDRRTRERGIMRRGYLDHLLKQYVSKSLSSGSFESVIWPVINFELWNRIFIDNDLKGYS